VFVLAAFAFGQIAWIRAWLDLALGNAKIGDACAMRVGHFPQARSIILVKL
jgi:hypothetical protein